MNRAISESQRMIKEWNKIYELSTCIVKFHIARTKLPDYQSLSCIIGEFIGICQAFTTQDSQWRINLQTYIAGGSSDALKLADYAGKLADRALKIDYHCLDDYINYSTINYVVPFDSIFVLCLFSPLLGTQEFSLNFLII